MKLFVIVAVLVAAVAAEEQKIVGGDIAEPNSIPFMVSIQVRTRRGYRHVCGGSLYNNLTVITSGNCARFRMRRMRVVVGEHNLRRSIFSSPDKSRLVQHETIKRVGRVCK